MPPTKKQKPAKPAKSATITVPCLAVRQGNQILAIFSMAADRLWEIVQINTRIADKDKGYQRVLSQSRVNSISVYVKNGNPIPTSILLALDKADFSPDMRSLKIPKKANAGWVIDGQHRLAGIHESKTNYDLSVVAFVGLSQQKQIEQFIKINREAKNVPTSLYLDLLKHLPDKNDSETAKERAADIADSLRRDDDSPFEGKIARINTPKRGELSLTNFVRRVAPLVLEKKGKLHVYSATEQIRILKNYYKAFEHVFPETFEPKEGFSIFFMTLGFGALMYALPTVFDLSLKTSQAFRVEDIIKTLKKIDDFDFTVWTQYGTGNDAENSAGEDFRQRLVERFEEVVGGGGTTLRL